MSNVFYNASWIWNGEEQNLVNQYVEFRHEFKMDNLCKESMLYISVDTNYAVWINGSFINTGQFSDYPNAKTFDILDVSEYLVAGKNALCILAYYQGKSTSVYKKGDPRLIYCIDHLDTKITSSESTFCRVSPCYKSGDRKLITRQLSFTYEYDASKGDNWLEIDYVPDSSWANAKSVCGDVMLSERPIKKLDIKDGIDVMVQTQGVLIESKLARNTVAQKMQHDFLSSRTSSELFGVEEGLKLPNIDGLSVVMSHQANDGVYLLLDMKKENVGFFDIDLEADEGTIIDISYGEHIDDLRVRSFVGGRNFANRYICCKGRQSFTHYFTRIAGRYIELHIRNITNVFKLFYAGIKPVEYPVENKGVFNCSDALHNMIYEVSVRTLHLCMHEHYEDCPWREQALYACDSRNQALCGYYSFGEYDFAAASIDLLGKGKKSDGYLELCAPAEIDITIPCFSLLWIVKVAEYLMYSGRVDYVKSLLPTIISMIDSYMSNLSDDLLITPQGSRYWNFYEWSHGMDNESIFSDLKGLRVQRFDAPLNMFFIMSLKSAAFIANKCGDTEREKEYLELCEQVKKAVHKKFWNNEKSAYVTYIGEGALEHYAELTQSLALCTDTCPEELASALRQKLSSQDNDWVKITLSHFIFKMEALMMEPEKYGKVVFDYITRDWGQMLYSGATSFWETLKGADDFSKAGSLCHGWSAVPVYFYYAYVLGVKPVEPGFKKYTVNPGYSIISHASGKVSSPYGDISVELCANGNNSCDVKAPDAISKI